MDGSVRVLHVEDDVNFAELTRTVLERRNSRIAVESVHSVGAALDLLAGEEFDCVVSDYDLPDRNGIELLDAVRRERPSLPFVLFTGKGSEEVASDAITAGVTDYLQKETGLDQYAVLANRIVNAVEHHRSQRALERRNRELHTYARMINSMREAACIYDSEGRFELVNEFTAEWYGTTREALEGRRSSLVSRIRAEADGDPFRELLDGEREGLQGEVESEFPEHGHAVLEYQLTPLRVGCEIEGVVGIVRDVTERRERRRELERTNALLSTLFETLPVGVLAEDASRNALAINRRMFELFDLPGSPDEVVGADCERLAAEVSGEFVEPAAFVRRTTELATELDSGYDEEWRLTDGRCFTRSYRSIGLSTDDGHLWVYRDVTDERRTEAELEDTVETLHELYEIASDPEMSFGAKQNVLLAIGSDYLDLPYGFVTAVEAETQTIVASTGTHELLQPGESYRLDESYCRQALSGENDLLTVRHATAEEWAEDAAYETFELETYLGGRVVVDGELYGTVCFAAAEPREEAFSETELTFVELLSGWLSYECEQREHRAQLEATNARLGEFASIVSHDLKNPLSVAEGYLQLVGEETDSEHLPRIERAHERMRELIDDILLLAREGDVVGEPTAVDLAAVAGACWRNVETAGAAVSIETDRSVVADRGRLAQLLENLLGNAIEHGGGDVTVTIGALPDGFYVADTGVGIPEAIQSRLFEPGYSTKSDGTGIGLQIVRQIVDAHGWEIEVTTGNDGGARFEITGVDDAAE